MKHKNRYLIGLTLALIILGSQTMQRDRQKSNLAFVRQHLEQKGSILAAQTGNRVRSRVYTVAESAAGFTVAPGVFNWFPCAAANPPRVTPLEGPGLEEEGGNILAFGYGLTGGEHQNARDGKTGLELWNGEFYFTEAQIEEYPGLRSLNTLEDLRSGRWYLLMSDTELTVRCSDGIDTLHASAPPETPGPVREISPDGEISQAAFSTAGDEPEYVDGELIVKFREGASNLFILDDCEVTPRVVCAAAPRLVRQSNRPRAPSDG